MSNHTYGAGTRLSSAYTAGVDGQPWAPHYGKNTAAHQAWTEGRTKRKALVLIWKYTHPDFRNKRDDGERSILVYRNGTCLVPLSALTEQEFTEKLASAQRQEAKR